MTLKEEFEVSSEANKHLMAHTERVLKDVATAYRGISHSVNRCNAEYADCWAAVEKLQKDVLAIQERQEAMANWLKEKFGQSNPQP